MPISPIIAEAFDINLTFDISLFVLANQLLFGILWQIEGIPMEKNMSKVGILTISDKGFIGKRVDKSGPIIKEMIEKIDGEIICYEIIPDEKEVIVAKLKEMVDVIGCDLILTTGGTGFSKRDVTPEATKMVIEREVPGFAEAIRAAGFKITPRALLSRAISGIRQQSLIVNLPGSPKSVRESLDVILPIIPHGLEILKGYTEECGN